MITDNKRVHVHAYCSSTMHSIYYTLMVLKTLNPLRAVVTSTPGNWGCQWSSLISFCPWWMKRSCGGMPSGVSTSVLESFSTAKSHCTTCERRRDIRKRKREREKESLQVHCVWDEVLPCNCLNLEIFADLVIFSSWSKHCWVIWVPFHWSDGPSMMLECGSCLTSSKRGE